MRAETIRLVQVSDCHLAADPAADYRGQNADANLARLSPAIEAFAPDVLVLTGDLSEDASIASYQRIVAWAGAFRQRVLWLPGNHDDRAVMAPLFDRAGFEAGPVIELGRWQLALLDSARVNDPAGTLDDRRLVPLEALDLDRPTGVFVHHQPVAVGAAWIDKVMLRAPERFEQRVQRLPGLRFVAFGHVHQRFRQLRDGVEFLACPSSVVNSKPATERFTAGESAPLARWFVLGPDTFQSGYLGR
ncbi:MAG: metallophosphoesterase [Wenzhouxiangellaceae bacterium]|nr:metallophosphoesterase [Wenzhouxiangellaceae bacterium]